MNDAGRLAKVGSRHSVGSATLTSCGEEAIDNFDYVSLTVWKGKSDFNAWRQGDAFKVRRSRAHTERSDERRVFVEMSTYKMSTSEMSTP